MKLEIINEFNSYNKISYKASRVETGQGREVPTETRTGGEETEMLFTTRN